MHIRKLLLIVLAAIRLSPANAYQMIMPGPVGSERFGGSVTYLPNGNLVVIDPLFDLNGVQNVGAVFIYRPNGELLSRFTGSFANDQLGQNETVSSRSKVWLLSGSNFLVRTTSWNSARGAVTFINGELGLNGSVSAANSLVGSSPDDRIGTLSSDTGIVVLSNGDYVVHSPNWDAGAVANVGAVTVGSGTTGISGEISASNSLIGTRDGDSVGDSVIALPNNKFVVLSPRWDRLRNSTLLVNAGAITWMDANNPIVGMVSESNSLTTDNNVGAAANFVISVTPLTQGRYVLGIPRWNNTPANIVGAGAVVWANGALSGEITAANAMTGTLAGDAIGSSVTALADGNYVVTSIQHNQFRGAVRWMNGSVPASGTHNALNSLVGEVSGIGAGDRVGLGGVLPLPNGAYVVTSLDWDRNGQQNVGAASFGPAGVGVSGLITASNSLVGVMPGDVRVSINEITVLTNGNYVIAASNWVNGTLAQAGAAVFGNGQTGVNGEISASNALIGSSANDRVADTSLVAGRGGVVALSNGHYVVSSRGWDNGAIANVGAATWGNGVTGTTGLVSAANSFVGVRNAHGVGGAVALRNGHYVIASSNNESGFGSLGAVTWRDGSGPNPGVLDISNSLMGSRFNDNVGSRIAALPNGNYVVLSWDWANGTLTRAGAITWGNGLGGTTGLLNANNSLVGGRVDDRIGFGSGTFSEPLGIFADSNYFVVSQNHALASPPSQGAMTLGADKGGQFGLLSKENTAFGGREATNFTAKVDYSLSQQTIAVGQPGQNRVVLQERGIFRGGFE
jgi:Repeat of unknown function (DUF5650)